jgi:hypothetical protein
VKTRTFKTQQLIDWGVRPHNEDECEHIVTVEELGMHSFDCEAALVFRAPDDGLLYRFEYRYNNGVGSNSVTGISFDPYVPECDSIVATRVDRVTRLIEVVTYEPTQD